MSTQTIKEYEEAYSLISKRQKSAFFNCDSGIVCPNCGGSMSSNNGYRICDECDYAEFDD